MMMFQRFIIERIGLILVQYLAHKHEKSIKTPHQLRHAVTWRVHPPDN
jgi:hypothetical protein